MTETITPLGELIIMGVDGDVDARNEFERRWNIPFQYVLDFAEEVKRNRERKEKNVRTSERKQEGRAN